MSQTTKMQSQKIPQSTKGQYLVDIDLSFGKDGGQQIMAELTGNVCSSAQTDAEIKARTSKLQNQIQSKQPVNKDILLVFKFTVQTGRERESFQFIEKGLDQYEENENISVMQRLFHRPKTTGRIQLKQGKGYIYVIYRFYHQHISDIIEGFEEISKSCLDINFNFKATLKGKSQASKRSFTVIKPDYLNFKFNSDKLSMKGLGDYLQKTQAIHQEQQMFQLYKLIKNLQIAKLSLQFNSLRKIMSYYNRVFSYDQEQKQDDQQTIPEREEREHPLSNKGIFKDSVSLTVIVADKMAGQAELKYKSEQIMLRLVARITGMIKNFDRGY